MKILVACLVASFLASSAARAEVEYRFKYEDEMSLTTCMAKINKWAEELSLEVSEPQEDGSIPLVDKLSEVKGLASHRDGICRIAIYK
jgi:hypothetical protein